MGETITNVRVPGIPGIELGTTEKNDRLKEVIQSFNTTTKPPTIHEHRIEDFRLIGRTISPSIANNKKCVECHNRLLGEDTFEVGDVMGAFVVESDLTNRVLQNIQYSVAAFFFALLGLGLIARREHRRMREVVSGLKARVRVEKMKREAEEREVFLRSHDNLTSLPNRTMFIEHMDMCKDDEFALALIDLDNFKSINDEFGHATGDALLIEISRRLKGIADCSMGLAARLGGDEFSIAVCLNDPLKTPEDFGIVLNALLADPFSFENNRIQPTCSVGISTAAPNEVDTTELLRTADAALYEAKAAGKNTYRVFDDTIKHAVNRREHLGLRLAKAIQNDEINIALQPKFNLKTGAFAGFEALARWNCDGEQISPDEFIPIAQQIGVVKAIDLKVLNDAIRFSVCERRKNGQNVPISVNICPVHFRSERFVDQLLGSLQAANFEPSLLTIEITESVAVENWERSLAIFSELRRLGIRISLDDFGTGYSSLSYLRSFKFEEIKIDRTFIRDIETNPDTKFIFETIVNLANGLGSTIVVEGIENQIQAELARATGASTAQGFLFGRPLNKNDAKALLSDRKNFAA